jgi:2-iminoacetate synthase
MNNSIIDILKQKQLDGNGEKYIERMNNISQADVERELSKGQGVFSLERLMTLISPAATNYLEEMARQARQLTIQRFGKTIQFFEPLYVSNFCINSCRYCGFNRKSDAPRTRLTIDEAIADADIIASEGFRNILIVSGEDKEHIGTEYLTKLAEKLRQKFATISIEIYPMSQEDYHTCTVASIDGLTMFQETYNSIAYKYYHPAGPKSEYNFRILSPDRAASAGMRRLGLGVLLGLCDWRVETLAMAEHSHYLMKKYWRSQVNFSFPRIRPALNTPHDYKHLVNDADMVQMMCALRLCFADSGITLSTREPAKFRDNLINICVTQISAGSKTNPGGYTTEKDSLEQFQISDDRTPEQIAQLVKSHGYEAVFKDWDRAFTK